MLVCVVYYLDALRGYGLLGWLFELVLLCCSTCFCGLLVLWRCTYVANAGLCVGYMGIAFFVGVDVNMLLICMR